MITVDQKEIIRREYFLRRKSIRQISRELKHSRKTVRKAIMDPEIPTYKRREPSRKPVMGPVIPIIKQWLEEDRSRPVKQRHTAKRIYERLKDEHGFTGSERTVRREVSLLREKAPDSHVPQTYDPGEGATFDFGEAQVIMNGRQTKVNLACMRLDYSSKFFVCALPTQGTVALFESHIRAFGYLEGVPHRIRYDNMKPAVQKILSARNRQEQALWVAFRSHFLFEADYCNPGRGQEKGSIENLVGYVRRNFLVPMPEVADFEELNAYLLRCCEEDAMRRRRHGKTVHDLWVEENISLLTLPCKPPQASVPVAAKVSRRQMVRFATNWYSVPSEYVGKTVTVNAFVFRIEIAFHDKVIAVHDRTYERNEEVLKPHHYLPVLLRKPGAFERATPIVKWHLPEIYERYRRGLKMRHEGSRGIKEYIRILILLKGHPLKDVSTAIEKALAAQIYSYDAVKNLLDQIHQPAPEPLSLHVNSPPVKPNSVDQFDLLLGA